MFILMSIIMMFVGSFFLIKAIKMPKGIGLNIVIGTCAFMLCILGTILFYGVVSRIIELPLN